MSEELLQSRFTDWKQRFDRRTKPELEKEILCSPAWEELWNLAWAEYDALENTRIAKGLAKQTWQDAVDDDRRLFEGMKKNKSKSASLTAYDWSQVPLAMILEKYLGNSIQSGDRDAAIALERWSRFRELITEQPEFRDFLSVSQKVSWTILTHWWSGAYQDPNLWNAAIASLKAASSSSVPMTYFFGEPYPNREAFVQGRKSVYNSMMLALFNTEFNPCGWEPYFKEITFTTVRLTRRKAIQHATAQRLAYTSYMNIKGFSTFIGDPYMSSMDKPCPWLNGESDDKEMPYFLWDVEQRRTVIVSGLGTKPEYCCVSHTWGRWRKEAVSIEGVPWLVPRNERFDVERLPEHLQQIRPRLDFIWIDLFCIPQDGSTKADDEINRQALIFQNSARCIAWVNDVRQWETTTKALDWLGIAYLHTTTCPGIYETDTLLQSLRHEAKIPSELFTSPDDLEEAKKQYCTSVIEKSSPRPILAINLETLAEPACWFSSLWTLQEAMLCPDMTFVTRDWVPLNDRSRTSIPLDTLFTFIDTVQSLWHNDMPYMPFTAGPIQNFSRYQIAQETNDDRRSEWPEGPRQLHDLCVVTRIDNLLESPSPIGLLLLANSRQSTGSRAPAIMSALGITDWYKPGMNAQMDLVLNIYPLEFVKEAATKLGASFYLSVTNKQKLPNRYDLFNRLEKGSMMPFSATSGWFSRIVGMPTQHKYNPDDHPAVKTWTIKQDGSVVIKRVGVVASSENLINPSELPMTIHFMKLGYRNPTISRFGDWAKDFPKGVNTYAVSLERDSGRQYGLILQGYRKLWFLTQRLVKVGTFITQQTDLPATTDVNWVVW